MHKILLNFRERAKDITHLPVYALAYIDDVTLVFPRPHFSALWQAWQTSCEEAGLHLSIPKCHAWTPTHSDETQTLIENSLLQYQPVSLPILGSVVNEELTQLFPPDLCPTNPFLDKRHEQAKQLASNISKLANAPTVVPTRQAAWILLVHCVSSKLNYDFRVSSPTLTASYSDSMFNLLGECAKNILPAYCLPFVTSEVMAQWYLPGHCGGLYLPNLYHIAAVSPLAMHLQSSLYVQNWLKAETPSYVPQCLSSADEAIIALAYLSDRDIFLDSSGKPDSALQVTMLDLSPTNLLYLQISLPCHALTISKRSQQFVIFL